MNKSIQFIKITLTIFMLSGLFSACGKSEPDVTKHSASCDQVTINITNSLDNKINDLAVDDVAIGDLSPGDIITNVCLDVITTDSGVYPYLNFIGNYEGQETGQFMIICGMGLVADHTGTWNIEITSVVDNVFNYEHN